MTLSLYVDGDRWREHLRATTAQLPGIVPVAKGNGYGFGLASLARRAAWLGVDTVAVGTYGELPEIMQRFDGTAVVLSPWRPFLELPTWSARDAARVVHTVSRVKDLAALAEQHRSRGLKGPRVVLEIGTSMRRHGLCVDDLGAASAALTGLRAEGLAMHLPLPPGGGPTASGAGHVGEVKLLLGHAREHGLGTQRVYVSHLSPDELAEVASLHPDVSFRPRVGTALWLGKRDALDVRATVLDVHPVDRGQRSGYRQRRAPRDGHIVVVSGGTAHGIGLEAPSSAVTAKLRALAIAKGSLDAAGLALSPYRIGGKQRWFAEPPHMQASMLFLPAKIKPPEIGAEVPVEVRFTTTVFDRVVVS